MEWDGKEEGGEAEAQKKGRERAFLCFFRAVSYFFFFFGVFLSLSLSFGKLLLLKVLTDHEVCLPPPPPRPKLFSEPGAVMDVRGFILTKFSLCTESGP